MQKYAVIAGGTGFIGRRLRGLLSQNGYDVTVISRMPGANRITWHGLEQNGLPKGTTTVVNLAGQNVLDPTRRWTPGFKQNVWNSRINSAKALVKAISKTNNVKAFINISGVSHYEPCNKVYCELDPVKDYDFMSKLCIEWEKAATLEQDAYCRNVKIRTGVVLGREGGMIKSIILPFWLGLGGPMSKGDQPLPWIHIDDLCRLILFSIENDKVTGVLNGVAPEIVTNAEFSKEFASSLRRPSFFPVPEFVVNMIFGKERSPLLLRGAKIKPQRAIEYGFEYLYPTARAACNEVNSYLGDEEYNTNMF